MAKADMTSEKIIVGRDKSIAVKMITCKRMCIDRPQALTQICPRM